jgi:hypothetical protein
MNTNGEINLKNYNLNNNYDEQISIKKKDGNSLFWKRLDRINSILDGFRSLIFLLQFIFILFVIISIIVVFNKINNVIKYIEDLPNVIKNGVTSIF